MLAGFRGTEGGGVSVARLLARPAPVPEGAYARWLLVVGMPRSGTTWLGKILDSHPETLYLHEPDSLDPLPLALAPEPEAARALAPRLQAWARAARAGRHVRVHGKLPLFRKAWRGPAGELAARASVLAAKAAARRGREWPVRIGQVPEEAPVIWKSIESLGRLGALLAALPGLRALVLVRHPCAYVASVLRGERARRFASAVRAADDRGVYAQLAATGVARRLGVDLDTILDGTPEERLAWRWALFNAKALAEAERGRVLVMRHEDLCERPREEAARALAHAGLGMHERVSAFIGSSTRGGDSGYYGVRRDPRAAASRWRRELPAEVQARVMDIAAATPAGALYDLS